MLDQYDHGSFKADGPTTKNEYRFDYETGKRIVQTLKIKFGGSDLFGKEKDHSFESSINSIYQTFDGIDVYPSVEEKAAHLLYFIVKNHSFVDGNKRIAAFIFVWFLEKNNLLYKKDGSKILENNALVAITLMIAQSNPAEKDIITKVVVNLISR